MRVPERKGILVIQTIMKESTIEAIKREKIIAIVRGVDKDKCEKVADALYLGGIRLTEVTFNQKDPSSFSVTAQAIALLSEKYKDRMLIGAGTVLTAEQVEIAANAGAKYIISPDVNEEVIRKTCELGLVSIPGAITPSEMTAAHRYGADFVKLFPAGDFGPSYVKAIRAPLNHIPMLAVGGVNENNVAEFLKAGICGAGIGGNLANKTWIEAGEYEKITATAKTIIENIQNI